MIALLVDAVHQCYNTSTGGCSAATPALVDAVHTGKLLALLQLGVLIYGHCSLCALV